MTDFNDDNSTSGPVSPQSFHVSGSFTHFTELPSKGYCRIAKAQRFGVWNVLKGLKPEYASDTQYQEMVSKEFSLMVGLNHPNIVRAYGLEEIPEWGTCIVMEFVDGRTLSDFIAGNPSTTLRKQVVFELLDALAYFHRKQIVHQDLKPSNILITHDGNHVKIIDFGLSDSREYAILKGPAYTKAYASPEQLAGEDVDNRSDIYTFGLIFQKLFPHNYKQIIKRCLQPQREKRFCSSESILEAIKQADAKRKWIPVSICAFFILLGLALSIFFYLNKQKNEQIAENTSIKAQKTQNNIEETSLLAENHAKNIDTKQTNLESEIQKAIISEKEAEYLFDAYCYNLKFELDSIVRPFDKEIKEGKILYYEIFHNKKMIVLTKISIHVQKKRQELPLKMQPAFIRYADNFWNQYNAKYPYTDADGNNLYPEFENLRGKGKISEDEYARLNKEAEEETKELNQLSNLLRIESGKD